MFPKTFVKNATVVSDVLGATVLLSLNEEMSMILS